MSVFCTLFALSFTQNLLAQQFNFRAINLATGTDGIDIHFNNIAQASLQNVAFGDASKILPGLPAVGGQFNLKISKTGEGLGAAFVDEDVAVQGGSEYTGVAYGGEGRRKVKVLERMTNQAPLAGRVLVRVLHAVNDVTSFDIYIGSVSGDPTVL